MHELYQLELTEAEMRWLQGHTAFEDGIGSDIYRKVIAEVGPLPPIARSVPLQVLERYEMHREPLADDAQARLDVLA